MKKLLFLAGMISCSCPFSAQYYQVMPASVTVAGAAVSDTSAYVAYNNPAAIAFQPGLSAGISAANRFLLKELTQSSLFIHLPLRYFHTTFNLTHNGFALYHEWMAGLDFSRTFGPKLSIGFQFNRFSFYSASSRRYYSAFFPQLGMIYFPAPKWTIGFQVFNPLQTNIEQDEFLKHLPSVYQLGATYSVNESLVWRLQLSGEVHAGYECSSGFEYRLSPDISVKGGLIWGEFAVADIGIAFFRNHLSFYLNTRIHPLLGLYPVSSIVYQL